MSAATMPDDALEFGPFSLLLTDEHVAIAVFNVIGEKQNILREQYLADADGMIDHVAADRSIRGLIIESGKEGSFIAGADVRMLMECANVEEAAALSRSGQRLFGRLEELEIPVVAAIDGACLGGGLELALACDLRICSESPSTVLGLPEVRLGLLPGSGGTQRLPRLIGIQDALRLMLTGHRLSPREAAKAGLVDEVVPKPILRRVSMDRLRAGDKKSVRSGGKSLGDMILEGNPIGRKIIVAQARKTAAKKSGGHYPAPEAIIECVEVGLEEGMQDGLSLESRKFGELARSPQAQALMALFLASNELKADSVAEGAKPRSVRRVGILGAGLMGAGIAYVSSANANLDVRLKDQNYESLAHALAHVSRGIERTAARHRLSDFERNRTIDRVTITTDYSGFQSVDLVVEAVYEDLDLKRRMVRDIESIAGDDVVFATNTSSIPIASIASHAARPHNVIGMHYFSPVEKMPLLEVVASEATSPSTIATAVEVGRRQGKTVIVVKDGPGFYVNRILAPYLNEATRMLVEGVPVDAVDGAMREFGFPVGPFELMDEVGLDVAGKVVPILEAAFGDRIRSSGIVEAMVAHGRHGKKSRKGFYEYGKDGVRGDVAEDLNNVLEITRSTTMSFNDIQDRCVLLLVSEAARCLEEGVIRGARDGDIGAVFGIGFPPFHGGPFRYVDVAGPKAIVTRMRALTSELGERFEPAVILTTLAEVDRRFH